MSLIAILVVVLLLLLPQCVEATLALLALHSGYWVEKEHTVVLQGAKVLGTDSGWLCLSQSTYLSSTIS